jgi:uncharacterized protein (TIGR03067 family)
MSIPMSPRRVCAVVTAVLAAFASFNAGAAENGFTSLFDGESLNGWEGNTNLWSVRDGAITGETKRETNLRHNTFLVWKGGAVDDFELRLSYRIVNGNSGIQYRSKLAEQGPQGPIVSGYQADFEAGKTYSGILYEERGRGILAQRGQMTRVIGTDDGKHKVEVIASLGKTEDLQAGIKAEDWNDYVIIARGNRLTHIINGRVTADVTDEDPRAARSGILAFQVHQGPPMVVQFKDVRLRKLAPAGEARAASDLDRLQGEWVGIFGAADGQAIPQDGVAAIVLRFNREKYDIRWAEGEDSGRIKLIEGAQPRRMEIESDDAGNLHGIYELDGTRLKIAYGLDGAPRPEDFNAAAGSSSIAITYERK